MGKKISSNGLEIIKKYEGCYLKAYKCPAGVWTIGYGHTAGVKSGMSISKAEAEKLLKEDCEAFEKYVNSKSIVPLTDELNQNQFDALVSFAFNVGPGNLKKLCAGRTLSEIGAHINDYNTPVATLHGYTRELISYTHGEGTLSCVFDGYEECHDAQAVIAESDYDPTADLENPPHSVFCAHGAGFVVPWEEVEHYKHLDPQVNLTSSEGTLLPRRTAIARKYRLSDEELEAIMQRTFGPIKRRQYSEPRTHHAESPKKHIPKRALTPQKRML